VTEVPKKIKGYIDVSRKSQIKILEPSRKSQRQARERVKTEFKTFIDESSTNTGVVIIHRATN